MYVFRYSVTKPASETFVLHSHNDYEILYFIKGDADYIVEGAVYQLNPHDIIIVRPYEMHRAFHKSNSLYERVVVNISQEFFEKTGCGNYTGAFLNRKAGTKNKIDAEIAVKCGLVDAYERLKKYTNDYSDVSSPIARAIITEILHIINNTDAKNSLYENRIQQVISYINSNYRSNITLSSIADEFFVSKSHLSREFHRFTGYTLTDYIKRKRINGVLAMCRNGKNISDACYGSGFRDYASFYRAFFKEYGKSPKKYIAEMNISK